MMSLRFNPVTLITRRRSKSKSKRRSESVGGRTSAGPSSVLPHDTESFETKDTATFPQHSRAQRSRFRLFNSLRRTRSPRRPTEGEVKEAITSDQPTDPIIQAASDITPISAPQADRKESDQMSPAPLAQNDCFELTDISDAETEEPRADNNRLGSEIIREDSLKPKCEEALETDPLTPHGSSTEEDTDDPGTEKEFQYGDSTSDPELSPDSHQSLNALVNDDEAPVPKLEVLYDTEYPICELSDSMVSLPTDTFQRQEVDDESTESESTVEREENGSTPELMSEEQLVPEEEAVAQGEFPKQETDEVVRFTQYTPHIVTERQVTDDAIADAEEETTVLQNSGAIMDSSSSRQEYTDYLEPSFEVEYDPKQDPFCAVEIAAYEGADQVAALTAPSIIVTSASSGSLKCYVEAEPTEPPGRPPPPADAIPKRPPPPSIPPPRPSTGPAVRTEQLKLEQEKKKKKKILGLVDLGPLPSDPDPNFPFRKHLEKSVVPNPKKAIKRIIQGETKAERRKRKEREELDRLLKGAETAQQRPVAEDSSEAWETFHNLTAEIDHTVLETVAKVTTAIPADSATVITEERDSAGGWANFEVAFGTNVDPVPVVIEDPWKEKENIKEFEPFFEFDTSTSGAVGIGWESQSKQTSSDHPESSFESGRGSEESASAIVANHIDVASCEPILPIPSNCARQMDTLIQLSDTSRAAHEEAAPLECTDDDTQPKVKDASPTAGRLMMDVMSNQAEEQSLNPAPDTSHTPLETTVEQTDTALPHPNTVWLNETHLTNALDSDAEQTTYLEPTPGFSDQAGLDPSDADEESCDDLLWGGFGEVRATSTEKDENPFGGDDFGYQQTNSVDLAASTKIDTSPDIVRPRKKAVRQETLSGNNPFRKREDDEEPDISELARAAAGIELTSSRVGGHKMYGSYESSNESGEDKLDGEVNNLHPSEQTDTTWSAAAGDEARFDPLQTIYPESENESVKSDEIDKANRKPSLSIVINEKTATVNTEAKSQETMPQLTAPPRPYAQEKPSNEQLISKQTSHDEHGSDKNFDDAALNQSTPAGWVSFSCDSQAFEEDVAKSTLSTDAAFEVDWSAASAKPETEKPPAPRPDTPDPDTDEPFYPPVEEGTWFRLWLRFPEKKTRVKQMSKYTTDRYWREIALQFVEEHGRKVINLHEINDDSKEIVPQPYRSIRIEPYMQLSREKLQQYDKYGKLHVFKLNHVSYREMVGVRPEKFSIKSLHNLVTHKPKQNVAVDHLPVYTEILKFGSLDQQKIRTLMPVFEDALMKIAAHKDSTLSYQREEVCCYVVDEYIGKVSANGSIQEQKARCRILCTAFVNGGPHIVLGLNDKWRYGREVVRRSDILPVMHDEWISIRNPEFHSCVEMGAYELDHMLKFYPLDGCRFELLRFRVSLRRNRELPLLVSTTYSIDGRRVSMRCELLVPGFFSASNRRGAVPCENVEIHIPVPEDWIYHFRVEKHHKYGSVHSALRKPGRIKGLERLTQMAQSILPPNILEASTGLAKYEHLYRAIVWRIQRIPEKTEASLRPHLLTCKLMLAPHDTVPEWETLTRECQVEYTMPSSTVSGATIRSISVEHTGVAEKFVKYTSKYKCTVDINYQLGDRKEPALKSVMDQVEELATHVNDEREEATGIEVQQSIESQGDVNDGEVADLLGLGDTLEPPVTENSQSQPISDSLSGLF